MSCGYDIRDAENVPAAIVKIRGAMTPPTMRQAEGWITLLQAATAHRADSEAGGMVAYALYASGLTQYPADVAKAACEKLARGTGKGTTWFPTYGEVIAMCDRMAAPRRIMLASLERWAPREADPRGPRSEEDKERVRRWAADYRAQVQARPKPTIPLGPPCHGPTDETGLSPLMRQSELGSPEACEARRLDNAARREG